MDDSRALVTFVFVVVYLAMCVGVGIWALRRTTSTRDFFMAGRNLGIMVTGLAVFSSQMSGFGFVGGPGLVYRMGLSSAWMTVVAPLGFSCAFYLLATRLRMVAELRDTISLPDAVAARYRSERARLLTAIAILLGVVGYLGTQILAMATVLRDVLNNVSFIPDVSIVTCMAIACAVLVFYCVTGGILASVYTDLVQGGIMIVAAVFVFFAAINAVDGGMAGIATTLMADDPSANHAVGHAGHAGLAVLARRLRARFRRPAARDHQVHDEPAGRGRAAHAAGERRRLYAVLVAVAEHRIGDAGARHPGRTPGAGRPGRGGAAVSPVSRRPGAGRHRVRGSVRRHHVHGRQLSEPRCRRRGARHSESAVWAVAAERAVLGTRRHRAARGRLRGIRALLPPGSGGAAGRVRVGAAALVPTVAIGFNWKRATAFTFAAALVPTVAIGFNWKRAAANTAIVASLVVNFGIEVFGLTVPHGINGGFVALLLSTTLFFGVSLASPPPRLDPDIEAVMDCRPDGSTPPCRTASDFGWV